MGNFTFYGHKQIIIMPVPVGVSALAKYFLVLLCAPLLAVHTVCGIKMLSARYINHHIIIGCKYTKQKQEGCFILVRKNTHESFSCSRHSTRNNAIKRTF